MRYLHLLLTVLLPCVLLVGCPDEGDDDSAPGDDDDTTGGQPGDCEDADGDGWRDGTDCPADEVLDCNDEDAKLNWDDADGDGATTCGEDCDDQDPNNFPDNTELCDGVDNDCDEEIDEDFDQDGDDYFDEDGEGCDSVYDPDNLDCDDLDPNANPGALEECDGDDNDCDGEVDEDFDIDLDGWTECGGDCNDTNAAINPDATEVCDHIDNDCDGTADDGFDTDGDGHTSCSDDCDDTDANVYVGATETCNDVDDDCDGLVDEDFDADMDGQSTCAGDCDDGDPDIYLGAPEICDGIDNDCDGVTTDEDTDEDGDGISACDGDCDDSDGGVYPEAPEVCNGIDDNCDLQVDEGFDADADGWTSCAGDCDDNDATVYPAAPELADGIDNDCDGFVDETNYCNPWEPVEAIGATKTFDVTYPMFGTGEEVVTVEEQTTLDGQDVYRVHGETDFGVDFDYYVWCDPADGAVYKYGLDGTVSGMAITEREAPGRIVVRAADEVGVITSWTENPTITYELYITQDFAVEVDYTDMGLETITVAGTTYDALHIHVEYYMTDLGSIVGDVSGSQDYWLVEDIGIVRYWYTWDNDYVTTGEETLFVKEMTSVTMP